MPKLDNPEASDSELNIDSDKEYELLEDSMIIPDTGHDQQLTYTQMLAYSVSGFAKQALVYSSQKIVGCFAVATIAPTAYVMTANYFGPTGVTSNVLARSTGSAVVSASFDLGSHVGGKIAETTWNLSSSVISNTLTFLYNRSVSEPKDIRPIKNPVKNKKKSKTPED